jgi:hypothetical protein
LLLGYFLRVVAYTIGMSIKISLTPNHISKDRSVIPRLIGMNSLSYQGLLDFMQKGTAMGKEDMALVFSRFIDALEFLIPQGTKVETPMGIFSPAIKAGALPPEAGAGDIPTEALRVNFAVNKPLLRRIRKDATFQIADDYRPIAPQIMGISPAGRDRLVNPLKQPVLMNLYGMNISFDPADGEQGIFLTPIAGEGPMHRIEQYSRAGSNHADFLIAGIPPGRYRIRLVRRTQRGLIQQCYGEQEILLQ